MPSPDTLGLFVLASLALLALPGPTMVYVVARTAEGGRSAGLVSALGVGAGSLLHVVAAVAGLSALVASSPAALKLIELVGAGYLVWLGVGRLRAAGGDAGTTDVAPARRSLFLQGVLMDALNPKTALFFLAFLPQFVTTDHPVTTQVLVLGLVFVALAAVVDCTCVLLAAAARRRLARGGVDRGVGLALVGLGIFAGVGAPGAA